MFHKFSVFDASNDPLTRKGRESGLDDDDQWEIVEKESYKWKDWRLMKSRDSLFIWCDAVAIEFRFHIVSYCFS